MHTFAGVVYAFINCLHVVHWMCGFVFFLFSVRLWRSIDLSVRKRAFDTQTHRHSNTRKTDHDRAHTSPNQNESYEQNKMNKYHCQKEYNSTISFEYIAYVSALHCMFWPLFVHIGMGRYTRWLGPRLNAFARRTASSPIINGQDKVKSFSGRNSLINTRRYFKYMYFVGTVRLYSIYRWRCIPKTKKKQNPIHNITYDMSAHRFLR